MGGCGGLGGIFNGLFGNNMMFIVFLILILLLAGDC